MCEEAAGWLHGVCGVSCGVGGERATLMSRSSASAACHPSKSQFGGRKAVATGLR